MNSRALVEWKSKTYFQFEVVHPCGASSMLNFTFSMQAQRRDYTYTGREYNRETGQYYYRARTYISSIGRFTGKDPIGYPGYEYVKGNPMKYLDSNGKMINSMWEIGGIASQRFVIFFRKEGTEMYQSYGLLGSQQDDFRHCTGACLISRTFGGSFLGATAGWIAQISFESIGAAKFPSISNKTGYETLLESLTDSANEVTKQWFGSKSPDTLGDTWGALNGCVRFASDFSKTCEEHCSDWAKNQPTQH